MCDSRFSRSSRLIGLLRPILKDHMFIYRLILSTSISGRQIALLEQSNILRIFKNGHILTPESFILVVF